MTGMVGGSGEAGFGEGAAAPPPRPDLTPGVGAPAARRRRRWPWIVAALVVLNAAVVAIVVTRSDGSSMPEEVAGLPRIRNDAAQAFEDLLSGFHVGGLTIHGAMYGSGDRAELLLERFTGANDPFQGLPVETVLGQAANGFGVSTGGGELDEDATVSRTRDGTDFACAPFRGNAASPAGASLGVGGVTVLCVFSGRATGLLADLRTSDPTAAIADAEAAEAALVGAG